MKLLPCIIIISCFSLALFTPCAHAQKIDLSVQVLPHKLTDTINDFDFSVLNTSEASAVSSKGIVKGAAAQSPSSLHPSFFTQIINGLDNLWFRIF